METILAVDLRKVSCRAFTGLDKITSLLKVQKIISKIPLIF